MSAYDDAVAYLDAEVHPRCDYDIYSDMRDIVDEMEYETAKLRELMKNALTALDNNCAECAYADGCTILKDCKCQAYDRLRDGLRDLGIEEE